MNEEGTTSPQKMKRLQSLNGWRRIWVVIAAISFLCMLVASLYYGNQQYRIDYDVISEFAKPECKYIVDMPAGHKPERELHVIDPCWHLYWYRSIYQDAKNTKDGYIEHMNALQLNAILLTFSAILLIYYLPGIGLLYGTGVTVAWVIKGFRSKGPAP